MSRKTVRPRVFPTTPTVLRATLPASAMPRAGFSASCHTPNVTPFRHSIRDGLEKDSKLKGMAWPSSETLSNTLRKRDTRCGLLPCRLGFSHLIPERGGSCHVYSFAHSLPVHFSRQSSLRRSSPRELPLHLLCPK